MNKEFISYEMAKNNILEQITETALKFSNVGITEFSIKCDEKHLDILKWEIVERFSLFGNGIPEIKDGIDLFIYGVNFKASSNSEK